MSVSAETVCSYHSAGVMYGQPRLVQSCIDWLEKTLLPMQSAELLQNIRLLFSDVCPSYRIVYMVYCFAYTVLFSAAINFRNCSVV